MEIGTNKIIKNPNVSQPAPEVTSEKMVVQLFHDGDLFFEDVFRAIAAAKEAIDFETYIFENDELGDKMVAAFLHAAQRGVKVRLLLDGVGSLNWNHDEAEACRKRGVEVRFFHPLPWQRRNFKFWKYLTLQKIILSLTKLNSRNHRKTCLIDGKVVFLGSMNVSAKHLRSVNGDCAWRDTSVRVEKLDLKPIQMAFNTAWSFSENYLSNLRLKIRRVIPHLKFRLNFTPTEGQLYRDQLIKTLDAAKTRIWITNPYFLPHHKTYKALLRAIDRGVDVRFLFPIKTDFWPGLLAARSYYRKLIVHGAKIFEYLPSMLHAKILIFDNQATVGSSNLNHRSYFHDLEMDILLTDPNSVGELCEQFELDLQSAQLIDAGSWMRRPYWIRMCENMFLVFRRLL